MQRGDKRDRWRSFSSTVLQIARSATVDGFFERFRFVATCRISFPEERTGQRVTVRVGSGPDRVCIPEKSRFFPLPFSIAAAMLVRATRGWRGILVCGRGGRIIECTLTRHPVSRLYSLPDNYNDNEASDDGRRWPAHTRPCSLLFILRSLPPSHPLPQALGAFVGIRGNFACWQLFHSARESRAPEYYYSIVFQRRTIVFNHNAPLRKFGKAMRYVSRNNGPPPNF